MIQEGLDECRSENPALSQTSELTSEWQDSVMALPTFECSDLKVIESKTVCYCSNFDLNINEWFNEYENIEIFKLNMQKNLGNLNSFSHQPYRLDVVKTL
jgi:hypothetical protein